MIESKATRIFKDLIAPPVCVICGEASNDLLCRECRKEIKVIGKNICEFCGRPLFYPNYGNKLCSYCRNRELFFYRHRSFSIYQGVIKKIIHKYKYSEVYGLGKTIASFLEKVFRQYYMNEKIDFIHTVPVYRGNKKKNFDQMGFLCNIFSNNINIPFLDNTIKIRTTARQSSLGYYQRMNNLRGYFKIVDRMKIYGKNILLVDDVWTTGSTLNELSLSLKKSGAGKIFLLTIARGNM